MNQKISNTDNEGKISFAEMRIRVGDRIQMQLPSSYGEERVFVKVVGFLDHVSLLVTAPEFNANRQTLREKEKVLIRGFSKQTAFAFDSVIKKVNTFPFSYLHLSFPEKIQGSLVRKDPRIKVRIIASIKKQEGDDLEEKVSVLISNLSASGAFAHHKNGVFNANQKVQVTFQIKVHGIENVMVMNAIIRNIVKQEDAAMTESLGTGLGLQFVDIEQQSFLLLQSLAYQQMIEQPDTVI